MNWWEREPEPSEEEEAAKRTRRLEFSEKTKRQAHALRNGICPGLIEIKSTCDRPIEEYDHIMRCEIKPDNSLENCRPLCAVCHSIKTAMDAKAAAKGRRIRRETKKSQQPKAKIRSAGFKSKEEREAIRQRYAKEAR